MDSVRIEEYLLQLRRDLTRPTIHPVHLEEGEVVAVDAEQNLVEAVTKPLVNYSDKRPESLN